MNRLVSALIGLSLIGIVPAVAQTTAPPTVPGNYQNAPQTNCPVGPCWVPFSASNPLPITPVSGGVDQDVNIVAVGGNAVTTTIPVDIQSGVVTVDQGNAGIAPWLVSPVTSSSQQTTSVQLGSAGTNLVLCSTACNLYSVNITIGSTSGYLLIHNTTTAPANGAVTPSVCFPVISNGTNGGTSLSWATPKYFSTGATAVFSTTGCFTQTASSASFIGGDVK